MASAICRQLIGVAFGGLLIGCGSEDNRHATMLPPLFPAATAYPFDSIGSYTINAITHDSIVANNSHRQNKRLAIQWKNVTPKITTGPLLKNATPPEKIIIQQNTIPVQEGSVINLPVHTVAKTFGADANKSGSGFPKLFTDPDTLYPEVNKVVARQTKPIKALPMRMKENASAGIQYLDIEQGLSFPYIHSIVCDSIGNLWLGTDGLGISKYNGTSFTNYSKAQGLSGGYVQHTLLTKKGLLWLAHENGLSSFDGDVFTNYLFKKNWGKDIITRVLEDSKFNLLWILKSTGEIVAFDGINFLSYFNTIGSATDTVTGMDIDDYGNYFITQTNSALRYNSQTGNVTTIRWPYTNDFLVNPLFDAEGNDWAFTQHLGVASLTSNGALKLYSKYWPQAGDTYRLMMDKSKNIWTSTYDSGISQQTNKSIIKYGLNEGLTRNKISTLTEDAARNIWLATEGGGINKIPYNHFSFPLPPTLFETNKIRPMIATPKGEIWMGAERGGLGLYNTHANENGEQAFTYYTAQQGMPIIGVRSLLQSSNGDLWIGTSGEGLVQFNGNRFVQYTVGTTQLPNNILDIAEAKDGSIWYGTINGNLYKKTGNNMSSIENFAALSNNRVYALLAETDTMWVGTDAGLLCISTNNAFTSFTEQNGLFGQQITAIFRDSRGLLWLGTQQAGVCSFDGQQFTYYTQREGLSNNNVWSVAEDSLHRIWVGTDKGLNLLVRNESSEKNEAFAIYNFGMQDGLRGLDFNLHSVCIDTHNRMYWGTGKGLASLDLNRPYHPGTPGLPKLNYVEINSRFYDYRQLPDSIKDDIHFTAVANAANYPENLRLSHNYNHLNFNFSAIEWGAPHKIRYSYRLIGLDDAWSNPSDMPGAEFRGLTHGQYTLEICAIGQSQIWTKPMRYTFTILPAWWQTWWFYLVVAIACCAIAYSIVRFIYRQKLRSEQTKMEKLLAVQQERHRIASEMHDDIGAGLSGVRLMTEITRGKLKESTASKDMDKIYDSVGDIAARMKEVIWTLNTSHDNLHDLVSFLSKQAKQMMEVSPITFNIIIPQTLPDVTVAGDIRRQVFLSVKETLHNVIKHAEATETTMHISYNKNLRIVISDNGKGLPPNLQDKLGNGINNLRMRMQYLHASFEMLNDKGTTIIFDIPIQ